MKTRWERMTMILKRMEVDSTMDSEACSKTSEWAPG